MNKRSLKTLEVDKSVKKMKHWSLGLLEAMKDPESIVKETNLLVIIKDKYPKSKLHYLVLPRDNISNIFQLNLSHISLIEHFGLLYEEVKNENKNLRLRAGFHAVPSMQRLHMHIISKDMISPCLKTKVHWNSFNTDFFIPYEGRTKHAFHLSSRLDVQKNQLFNVYGFQKDITIVSYILKPRKCVHMMFSLHHADEVDPESGDQRKPPQKQPRSLRDVLSVQETKIGRLINGCFKLKFAIAILNDLKEKGSVNKIPKEVHKSLMNTPLKCNQCNYEPKNMPQLKQHLLSHEQ